MKWINKKNLFTVHICARYMVMLTFSFILECSCNAGLSVCMTGTTAKIFTKRCCKKIVTDLDIFPLGDLSEK